MKIKKIDRRVSRTQEMLRKSLFPLIISKGYDAITVQDILDQANVGRSTFYAHFKDKDDLLLSGFDVLIQELFQHIKNESQHSLDNKKVIFRFSLPLLEHANENRLLFKALLGNRGGILVQKKAFEMIVKLVKYEILNSKNSSRRNQIEEEIRTHFYAGAFFSTLKHWLEGKIKIDSLELDEYFQAMCINYKIDFQLR